MEKGDKFVLLTAEPSWYAIGETKGDVARDNLQVLIAGATSKGAKLCGISERRFPPLRPLQRDRRTSGT